MLAKRREIIAFNAQQVMPVAQEGIEKMTPTVANASSAIAQSIAKGIKEGLSDDNTVYCKHCGSQVDKNSSFCKKCRKPLQ